MATDWQEIPEAGSATAIRFLVWVARVLGRRMLHVLLIPVAAYFVMVRGADRRASRDYLGRVLGRRANLADVYKHFYTFARVVSDRFYFITGETNNIPIRVHGAEALQKLVALGRGGIVLSAHLGSFEAARVLGTRISDVVLRMVLDREVNKNLIAGLEALNPAFRHAVIDLNQPPASLALEIADALKRGEWIGFLSDRHTGADRTEQIEFLGNKARFPAGPCVIAGMFNAPLISVFPLYIEGRYEVYCEILSESVHMPRAHRQEVIREHLEQFVRQLEKYARLAPYNWFNFFDYWGQHD
jgi:predicted LPLAT superfamily acyltransferase